MEENAVGRWQVPSDPELMINICSMSVLESCMKHCLCETMLLKQKERYRVRAVQMDNLRGLLCIKRKRMDGVSNAQIREYGE